MVTKKNFGFIPNEEVHTGHKVIVNKEDWTVTISWHDMSERDDFETMADLEKSLQNLSMDTELDAEKFVNSPSNKKVKCSTPLNKMINVARSELPEEQYHILEEMIDLLPNVLNEKRKNGHLETWVNLNRLINQKSFPYENIRFLPIHACL